MLYASSSTRSPPQGSPCGLFRCYPSAHTACASGERGCLRCGVLAAIRAGVLRRNSGRTGGKTAAARRRRNVRHSAGRTDTQTPQTRGRPRVCGGHRTRSCAVFFLAPAALLRRREEACGMTGRRRTHILGCCPQRPLHIADEALEEPGGSPSGEEGPLSGGLARDLFLKELRARIGEKWGLLPDGDAAGFPLLFFVRRIVLRASGALHL